MGDGRGTSLINWRGAHRRDSSGDRHSRAGVLGGGQANGWAQRPEVPAGNGHGKVAEQSQTPLRVRIPGG